MNQNELIDLACEWLDAPTNGNIVLLRPVTLGNFELFVINARAPMLEQISVLKQRLAEVEKDYSILEQNYDAAYSRIKELEQALRECKKQVLQIPRSYGYEITLIPVIDTALGDK